MTTQPVVCPLDVCMQSNIKCTVLFEIRFLKKLQNLGTCSQVVSAVLQFPLHGKNKFLPANSKPMYNQQKWEKKSFNNHDAPLRFLTSPWNLPRSRHGQRQCAMEVTQVEVVLSGRAAQCIQHSNSWEEDIWPNSLIHSVEVVSDFQPNNVLAAGYNFPVKYKIHNIAYEEPLGYLNVTFVLKNIKSTFWIH